MDSWINDRIGDMEDYQEAERWGDGINEKVQSRWHFSRYRFYLHKYLLLDQPKLRVQLLNHQPSPRPRRRLYRKLNLLRVLPG